MNFNVKIILLIALIFAVISVAEIPRTMNYQGKLTDASGIAVHSPAGIAITFRIFDVSTGGSALWTEAHASVPVNNGLFDILLGEVEALNLPFDEPYWIELIVDGELLEPREKLSTVGYAFRAAIADSVAGGGGVTGSGTDNYLARWDGTTALQNSAVYATDAGNVGIGTTSPTWKLHVDGEGSSAITGYYDEGSSSSYGQLGKNPSTAVFGYSTVWAGYFNGNGYFSGNVGIGTDSPEAKLDVNGQIKIRGGSPGVGKLLQSDGSGIGSWVEPSTISDGDWTVSGTNMYSAVSGNVGIGTTAPATPLDVYRSDASNSFIQARSDVGRMRLHIGPTANYIQSSEAGSATGRDIQFSNVGGTSTWMTIKGATGNVGIGTPNPASKLSVGGAGISDCAIYGEGTSYGVYGSVSGGSGINTGVYGVASGDGMNLGGEFSSESELGSVFGIRAKADYTGSGTGQKVIGADIRSSSTTSPQYGLYVNSKHTGTTGSNRGIYSHATLPLDNTDTLCGVSSSAFRYGVDGVTYGVYAQADSGTNVYGVYAEGEGGSDTTCGVYGVASGDGMNLGGSFSSESEHGSVFGIRTKANYSGSGTEEKVIGADIRSSSTTSPQYGLYVESKHTGTTGFNQGIFSNATLPLGNTYGLCGITSSASREGDDGPTHGVYVHADRGREVYGVYAEVVPGSGSVTTCGVYGHVLGGSPGMNIGVDGRSLGGEGTNIGVRGEAPVDSPTNWAGFFAGNVHVTNNVGIGTTSPTYKLQLSTDSAAKPTSNTWTVVSDKRLKEDISPYSEGLESILRINPIWFTYNGKAGMPRDTGVGVIAQDLQEIAPYMVNTWIYDDGNGNQTEYLGVNNGAMTYMLINAVKEQQAQIEALEAENAELRSEIERLKTLEARIEALENE